MALVPHHRFAVAMKFPSRSQLSVLTTGCAGAASVTVTVTEEVWVTPSELMSSARYVYAPFALPENSVDAVWDVTSTEFSCWPSTRTSFS
ncbi:hypothetical protein D3C73_1545190 [compost metagenome]